jgi:hypothetical protein
MTDWMYIQENPAEQLAQMHYFSFVKRQPGGDIPFRITIKEFAAPPPGQRLRFFAEADKAVNQKTAPFVPCGWGNTLFNALGDCMRLIRQFPYEGCQEQEGSPQSS